MVDNEYEVIPHQLLNDLKFDVEELKKKLMKPDAKANELILEIESLKDSIHELHTIFHKALEETKGEDVSQTIPLLKRQVDMVVSQNETIARGMIAISDKLEEFMKQQGAAVPRSRPMIQRPAPSMHTMGLPESHGPARIAPPPAPMVTKLPPPPPPPGKSKSLGTLFS